MHCDCKHAHGLQNMVTQCTNSETFQKKLEELKSTSKNKSSFLDVYVNDSFYEKAYQWLKPNLQGKRSIIISQTDMLGIIEKLWRVTTDDGKILDKQNRYVVLRTIHNPCQFAFCHSASRMRQDRRLCEKALFRYNTEGHFKTCSYQYTAYTNNKEVLKTTKRNRLTIQFRQIFHKPCWNWLNKFQKLGTSMERENTHMASSCIWPLFKVLVDDTSHRQTKSWSDCWIRETVLNVWLP